MSNQYNVLIDVVGVFLVGAILISGRAGKQRGNLFSLRLLRWLMLCCILVFAADIPGLLLDGKAFRGAKALLWFFDSAYWALQTLYCWLWLLFADYWAFGAAEGLKRRLPFYTAPMLLELALIAANPLTGWIFTINGQNVYARGTWYVPNMLPYAFYIFAALTVTLLGYRADKDPEGKRRKLSLMVYMFLPVCGVVFDIFVYGISWVWPMVALSLLMVYLNVQQQDIAQEQLAAAKMEAELVESRVAIMLSQIQPHFLYNSLTSIYGLCETDPQRAQEAVGMFSSYLRFNMDFLKHQRPVWFRVELKHVEIYLALEKMRFDELLHVVWDVRADGFMLPSLTVQPLVENAVKYGVGKKPEGGTVTISTREYDDCFTVTVSDDGVGFDLSQPQSDGRTHIGIDNVRSRLASMSRATLQIESVVGVGTASVITIPKEKASCRS